MVSRLLDTLEQQFKTARSNSERIGIAAERAGVLARLGRLDEATSILTELRASNAAYDPLPTVNILLSEGMVEHYRNRLVEARDKFRRAYAISAAVGLQPIKVRSAAWLASNAFQLGNIAASTQHAAEAVRADEHDHSTLARARLAAADLYMFAGGDEVAKGHYKRARQHAVQEGDLAMQSSILYNYAAFRVHNTALSSLRSPIDGSSLALVELEVSTPGNLDAGIGTSSLKTFVPLLKAQLLTICGRWREALELFERVVNDAETEGRERELAKFHCYIAQCHSGLGNDAAAMQHARKSEALLPACTDLDDLAIVYGRLGLIFEHLAPDRAQFMHEAKERCLSEFLKQQRQDLEYVQSVLGNL